jgi:hypothetical protein
MIVPQPGSLDHGRSENKDLSPERPWYLGPRALVTDSASDAE